MMENKKIPPFTEETARACEGRVSSLQSMGTLDGPGIRYVVFLQGCPLRCACCHNPETWDVSGGTLENAGVLFDKILRYRNYFGRDGGVTVSGGEALLQPRFTAALFWLCHRAGIHTCLDTSGCILTDEVRYLLSLTDLVLLDIKYTNNDDYVRYVGCTLSKPLEFLAYLQDKDVPVHVRQVIIEGKNDSLSSIKRLSEMVAPFTVVKKTELLPFHTLCRTKYESMGIPFAFSSIPDTQPHTIERLSKELANYTQEAKQSKK